MSTQARTSAGPEPGDPGGDDAQRAAEALARLVRIPTVSRVDQQEQDADAFAQFPRALAELFPLLHRSLEAHVVGPPDGSGPAGLLFHWRGRHTDRPVVLMAHWDVVPVDDQSWTEDPFGGRIDRQAGVVHGRGTLDDKGSLVVICRAVESLLAAGVQPQQDIYLSFGCDEEVFGRTAPAAVEWLHARGVRPWLVIDEGGAVVEGVFPGLRRPAALIGVAEKGTAQVRLQVDAAPGHAATPSRAGAVARLARALHRIERNPFPTVLTDPALRMVQTLGAHVDPPLRSVLAHAELARPAVARALAALGPEPAAVVRTTVALTRLRAGTAANVIAARAQAAANVRIQIGETQQSVLRRLQKVVRDEQVQIEIEHGSDPTPVSPSDGAQFAALERAVASVYPEAVVSPYVMLQASDARHFHRISDHVYRFSPFAMTAEQRASIHGIDENIAIESLGRGVQFFRQLIRDLPG